MASSRVQIAEFASVSRQAVHKALRRGWLAAEADGRIESHDRFWPKCEVATEHGNVRCLGAGSTGRRNTGVKSLCGGFKLQGLTWSFIELTSHFVQIGLRMHR
jgi:hypothetical protein